jgi:hypothetical protein
MKMSKLVFGIAILVLVIFAVIFGPLLTIWALNILFPVLAIPYTFETWCAAVILGLFLHGDGIKITRKA